MKTRWPNTHVAVYGWEGNGQYWHGPTEWCRNGKRPVDALDPSLGLCISKRKLRAPDGLPLVLTTTIRDMGDCAVATIDSDPADSAPLTILAVLPAERRSAIRAEFAFELTSFVRFLEGPCSSGSELAIHDHIQETIETDKQGSIVFAISSVLCTGDLSIAVSEYIEQLSISILEWMSERGGSSQPPYGLDRERPAGCQADVATPNC